MGVLSSLMIAFQKDGSQALRKTPLTGSRQEEDLHVKGAETEFTTARFLK